jgi:fluoride exporter
VTVVWVALAGMLGVLARYGLASAFTGDAGLAAIVFVNVSGSFALGVLTAVDWWTPEVRTAVGTGFLGGFTTYSTFSVQAVLAADGGRWAVAVAYVAATVVLGLGAAAAGYALARA